ncbi:MAG: hypothetical protein LW817_00350, partial [Candidatus Caenarcaniphilales bacterium]|nr:hypothetical protein [Candidatus Caenarcaniphilales bacterium]
GSDGGPVRYVSPYLIVNYNAGTIPTYITGIMMRGIENSNDTGPIAFSGNVGAGITAPARKLHISEAMRLEPQSSPPASPVMGDLYVDSDTGSLCFYNGSAWVAMNPGGCS